MLEAGSYEANNPWYRIVVTSVTCLYLRGGGRLQSSLNRKSMQALAEMYPLKGVDWPSAQMMWFTFWGKLLWSDGMFRFVSYYKHRTCIAALILIHRKEITFRKHFTLCPYYFFYFHVTTASFWWSTPSLAECSCCAVSVVLVNWMKSFCALISLTLATFIPRMNGHCDRAAFVVQHLQKASKCHAALGVSMTCGEVAPFADLCLPHLINPH